MAPSLFYSNLIFALMHFMSPNETLLFSTLVSSAVSPTCWPTRCQIKGILLYTHTYTLDHSGKLSVIKFVNTVHEP